MPMPITKGFRTLVDEAMAEVTIYSVDEVKASLKDQKVQIVDIRDVRELTVGTVVGSFHAPRGMLAFLVDPASPYRKPLQDIGMRNVAHIDGGYAERQNQGAPTETLEERKTTKASQGSKV